MSVMRAAQSPAKRKRGHPVTEPPACRLEATVGIEPTIGVLQTPALTTWPRRHKKWSGRRDSNSRPPPWQGGALPLSHFRSRLLAVEFYHSEFRTVKVARMARAGHGILRSQMTSSEA